MLKTTKSTQSCHWNSIVSLRSRSGVLEQLEAHVIARGGGNDEGQGREGRGRKGRDPIDLVDHGINRSCIDIEYV